MANPKAWQFLRKHLGSRISAVTVWLVSEYLTRAASKKSTNFSMLNIEYRAKITQILFLNI